MSGEISDDVEVIGRYLARRDIAAPGADLPGFDVLVLCGSAVLPSVEVAARCFHEGVAGRILVTGGVGHSTPYLMEALRRSPRYAGTPAVPRPEAQVFADLLRRHFDVPGHALTVEAESTNCGQNAEFSVRLLAQSTATRVLLLQDSTMQRRTHASFERHGRALGLRPRWLTSYAPVMPSLGDTIAYAGQPTGDAVWSFQRFTSLALGEIRRLQDNADGYGPRGADYIDHVDIPDDVLDAYRRLRHIPDTPSR